MDFLDAQTWCGYNREEEDILYCSKKKVRLWDVDDEIITDKEILCYEQRRLYNPKNKSCQI